MPCGKNTTHVMKIHKNGKQVIFGKLWPAETLDRQAELAHPGVDPYYTVSKPYPMTIYLKVTPSPTKMNENCLTLKCSL